MAAVIQEAYIQGVSTLQSLQLEKGCEQLRTRPVGLMP